MRRSCTIAFAASALASTAAAQFGNQWVSFSAAPARLAHPPGHVSDMQTEVDFAWGDLDQDGWVDLVVARKQPFTTGGKRPNMLLMNRFGVLQDETALHASASDVPGDQGFLTLTNDRDVAVADVDRDGWLDVITATTLSFGDPKHVSHPRVYRNLGRDAQGQWRGLRFEDARIPQFLANGTTPTSPMFCSVSAGDVTGDGYPDLYFADYDSGGIPAEDLEDRLLINDGTGHFSDQSFRMPAGALDSGFGTSSYIADINGDGLADIMRNEAFQVTITYQNPASPGTFQVFDNPHNGSTYHTTMGDLNNDGRLDLVFAEDGDDAYRYNLSTDQFGRVVWSNPLEFQFLAGGDDSIAGNDWVADLDNDGWNDVIITDVDVDISGCGRRMHVYRNPGGAVGGQITLREERESSASTSWLGAGGLLEADLEGTHDVAVFDIDLDGYLDLVLGRCTGTFVWRNAGPGQKAPSRGGPLRGPITR